MYCTHGLLKLTRGACCVFAVCRLERANAQVITRSRTGNLPPNRAAITNDGTSPATGPSSAQGLPGPGGINKVADTVSNKATSEEIKEKMEQQLRIQRLAHQQKRALEMKGQSSPIVKMVANAAQSKSIFFIDYFFQNLDFLIKL